MRRRPSETIRRILVCPLGIPVRLTRDFDCVTFAASVKRTLASAICAKGLCLELAEDLFATDGDPEGGGDLANDLGRLEWFGENERNTAGRDKLRIKLIAPSGH